MAALWGGWAGRLAALLILGTASRLSAAEVVPLAVAGGRYEAVLPTDRRGEQYYLVLGSLARGAGLHRVTVRTEADPGPADLPVAEPAPPAAWRERVRGVAERLER